MDGTEHTPGPWRVTGSRRTEIVANYFTSIGVVFNDHAGGSVIPLKNAQANARLIAAAPELLAACQVLLERMRVNELGGERDPLPYDRPAVEQAKAAIARAKDGTQ